MKLEVIKETVEKFVTENLKLDFEKAIKNNTYYLGASIILHKLADTNALLNIKVNENDEGSVLVIFDKIDNFNNVSLLINKINVEIPYFKAYIDDDGFFVFEASIYDLSSKEALEHFLYDMIRSLVSDETSELLLPVIKHLK